MHAESDMTEARLAALVEASEQARKQALAVLDLAARVAAEGRRGTAAAAAPASERLAEMAREEKQLMANVAQLRSMHRNAYFGARETKAQTVEARQEVDRLHLQLQNLYYEQRHLEGEIAACENFEYVFLLSTFPISLSGTSSRLTASHSYKHLPLIPEEEFLALHPELEGADEVALMTARIAHEKQEREALDRQKSELFKRKLRLTTENKKRKEDLANLDKDLEKFIDVSFPRRVTRESTGLPIGPGRCCAPSFPHAVLTMNSQAAKPIQSLFDKLA